MGQEADRTKASEQLTRAPASAARTSAGSKRSRRPEDTTMQWWYDSAPTLPSTGSPVALPCTASPSSALAAPTAGAPGACSSDSVLRSRPIVAASLEGEGLCGEWGEPERPSLASGEEERGSEARRKGMPDPSRKSLERPILRKAGIFFWLRIIDIGRQRYWQDADRIGRM